MTWAGVLLWANTQLSPWISDELWPWMIDERQWIILWVALAAFGVLRWANRRWPEKEQ